MSDCIFCKIIEGEIPSKKLHEDDEMVAFHDINPVAPVHFLVVPKKHIKSLLTAGTDDAALLGRLLNKAQELSKQPMPGSPDGCGEDGARFVINVGFDGGQTVDHLHVHVLGGRVFGWPPG